MIAFCQIEKPLKSILFRLKRAFFADELGIIKIMALGGFWGTNGKSRWHSGGRLGRLWRNLGKMRAESRSDGEKMQFGCLDECIYRTYV